MKKLINQVENVLIEQLQGFVTAHPELQLNLEPCYIVKKNLSRIKLPSSRAEVAGTNLCTQVISEKVC